MPKISLQNQSALTQARLREVLTYDPATGFFRWLVGHGRARAGDVAGCVDTSTGYRKIAIDGRKFFAHRLAHFYMTGEWPDAYVDHRGNLSDVFANLRPATHAQNLWNRGSVEGSTSRFKGVYWDKSRSKWSARVAANKVVKFLGRFADEEAAARAYDDAAIIAHGEFARLNFPVDSARSEA